jgi:hypothetical protein
VPRNRRPLMKKTDLWTASLKKTVDYERLVYNQNRDLIPKIETFRKYFLY